MRLSQLNDLYNLGREPGAQVLLDILFKDLADMGRRIQSSDVEDSLILREVHRAAGASRVVRRIDELLNSNFEELKSRYAAELEQPKEE